MSRRRDGFLPAVIALTSAAAVITGCATRSAAGTATVDIRGRRFNLDVADDDRSRTRGLMGVTRVPPDGGMLFVFAGETVRWFWMGYCLIDIDLIFLDAQGVVTAVARMKAEPPRGAGESDPAYRARLPEYSSVYPARFAIELAAGSIDRLGVEPGDVVLLSAP